MFCFGIYGRQEGTSKLYIILSINLSVCISKERRIQLEVYLTFKMLRNSKCSTCKMLSNSLPLNLFHLFKSQGALQSEFVEILEIDSKMAIFAPFPSPHIQVATQRFCTLQRYIWTWVDGKCLATMLPMSKGIEWLIHWNKRHLMKLCVGIKFDVGKFNEMRYCSGTKFCCVKGFDIRK